MRRAMCPELYGVEKHRFDLWPLGAQGLWPLGCDPQGDDSIIGLVGPFFPDGWPETEIGWLIFDGAEGQGLCP